MAAQVRGECWHCLGRSEQASPSQAFLEQNLTICVVGRASEQATGCVTAFLPAAAEYLLAELATVLFLQFATLILANMQHGRFVNGAECTNQRLATIFLTCS